MSRFLPRPLCMGRLARALRRLARREDGTATLEFAILFPAFIIILVSAVEVGFITMRHTLLDRAVDMTVRDIRLGTGTAPQYEEIRDTICERAGAIPDCRENVKIEMIRMDLRNWTEPPADYDCVNHAEEVQPVRTFTNGMQNEMMLLRICAMFEPIFPLSGLGRDLKNNNESGYTAMISSTAFVQEPL
ncbi:MAG: pilus assembly protein [Rhodobacterales bacterium]|nr:pilus assembly protein [Rhodobacterales bacterium]MDX5390914.1 pilus assembly protein [Rhodobacterales bacterium]MDX5490609.1 pilus assembly protein [Rhodobacterales bacterium]